MFTKLDYYHYSMINDKSVPLQTEEMQILKEKFKNKKKMNIKLLENFDQES
jgi:hypothetical protein